MLTLVIIGMGSVLVGYMRDDIVWETYTNMESGYTVGYPAEKGAVSERGATSAGYRLMREDEADHKVFTYLTDVNISRPIGVVHCAYTGHLYDDLFNDMSLRDYAVTLYNHKLEDSAFPIRSVQPGAKDKFAGREAYPFILAEDSGFHSIDREVTQYIVTENTEGQKCTISYGTYDLGVYLYPELFDIKQQWLNSFQWIR